MADELREYQQVFIDNIYRAFEQHRRVLAQLPTGGGKTVCFVKIMKDWVEQGDRILLLVHRRELIKQAEFKIFKSGINYGFIMAGEKAYYSRPVQIASVQTIIRRPMPERIDAVIIDESHHAPADSYKKVMDEYPEARILGFTATPIRRNGEGFEGIFDVLVTGPSVQTLIDMGFLVTPRIFSVPLREDLSKLRTIGGDYREKDIEEIMDKDALIGDIVKSYGTHARGCKTITFATSVKHSQHIVDRYNAAGISAVHIDGNTNIAERDLAIKKFERGDYMVLSNVGIATEGTDIPAIDCVQMAKPTKSLSLYLQMVGRGLRPTAEKDQCIIIDHANNVFTHLYPQEDREWSLKGMKKRKNALPEDGDKIIKAKAPDGRIFDPSEIPREVTSVELIELIYRVKDDRKRFLTTEVLKAKKAGYAPLIAFKRLVEKFGTPTVDEILTMQKLAGYKKGWIRHMLIEHGYSEKPKVPDMNAHVPIVESPKWTF